jgi:Zn ribbon nucleic-acid-binding protein
MIHQFEVIDPELGQLSCVSCGAVDKIDTDTWHENGRLVGYVICADCGGQDDIASVPIDVTELAGSWR